MTRRVASVGDWVIATGSAKYHRTGHLVSAMRVTETMTFDDYWTDPRFQAKRPDLQGSRMQAFGDNIYSRDANGDWLQLDSHHSLPGGVINSANVADDTQTNRVLLSDEVWYFGASARLIPAAFRGEGPANICAHRGHKKNFAPELVDGFLAWLHDHPGGAWADPIAGRPDPNETG